MVLTNPLFGIFVTALALGLGWLVTRSTSFYSRETHVTKGSRYESLDGLRGFLAFAVFLTHVVLSYRWYETGKWASLDEEVYGGYRLMGSHAVSIFFMITGFLFWGKLLKTNGRPGWKALYASRIRRLVPLYLFSVLLVLVVVAIKSDFELHVSLSSLARQAGTWLTFSLIEPMNLNGVSGTERINAGVLWTLAYEWKFYAALPLLAWFLSPRLFLLLATSIVGLVWVVPNEFIILNFLFGMITAHWMHTSRSQYPLAGPFFSCLIAVAVTTVLFFGQQLPGLASALLLFGVFFMVANGNTLFGLLVAPCAKYLGIVSYSMYLLHGIVLYACLAAMDRISQLTRMSSVEYWGWSGLIATAVVLFSGVTYRYIEHPFLCRKKGN